MITTTPYSVVCNSTTVVDLFSFLKGPSANLNNDQVSVTAQLLVDCRCQLGECVLWDDRTQRLLFVSILDKTFHVLDCNFTNNNTDDNDDNNDKKTDTHQFITFQLPKMVGSFGLLETPPEPNTYLLAWEDGFQIYNVETNQPMGEMSNGEPVNPLGLPDRLNDGRCDPIGTRFICGGCTNRTNRNDNSNGNPTPIKVYKCEYNSNTKRLEHTAIVDSIQTTNSICWSLDGRTMYLANSPDLMIHQYDYDTVTGTLSNQRHFHDKSTGFADGSCVDAQGFVWNATWRQGQGTGMVDRIDPKTGQVVFTVYLPDKTSEASCCCFGGPNLDILFITTAWEHLDPSTEIHAGGLYAVKLPQGMVGLKEKRFITEGIGCV